MSRQRVLSALFLGGSLALAAAAAALAPRPAAATASLPCGTVGSVICMVLTSYPPQYRYYPPERDPIDPPNEP